MPQKAKRATSQAVHEQFSSLFLCLGGSLQQGLGFLEQKVISMTAELPVQITSLPTQAELSSLPCFTPQIWEPTENPCYEYPFIRIQMALFFTSFPSRARSILFLKGRLDVQPF